MIAFVVVYVGAALLTLPLAWAERRWPASVPRSHPRDRVLAVVVRRRLDLSWWLFTPLVTGTFTRSVTWGVIASLAFVTGRGTRIDAMLAVFHDHTPLPFAHLPLVAQAPLVLLVADVVGYFSHRLRHSRALWPFHQVHHSPRALDFLVSARMHPVDDVVDNVAVGVAVLACGFDPLVIAFLGPALILHTMLIHADLTWDFGPLRLLIASPAFHRLHHARVSSSRVRHGNYAQLFPFLDALFGTLQSPPVAAVAPLAFGVDEDIPSTLSGQLAWPIVLAWRTLRGRR